MACTASYELHHHFPKLADESGFTFSSHRPRVHINWNKIKLINIENLIRERKFSVVEEHINDILDCVLESEFDVRILDDGVLKMFRLAQLAVEYQQFCRHYLDRSVHVLRQEICNLAQELDITKKNLHEKEEELRKLRKRTRHAYKTPLPYGNDNIAAVILKTLNNKGDLFTTTSRGDLDQYNKCAYCEKVFLNQLYLQSHILRRHPQQNNLRDNETHIIQHNNENSQLNTEVMELKNKLQEMEALIISANKHDNSSIVRKSSNYTNQHTDRVSCTRDAEVSTNDDDYLLNNIAEQKKEDHEKCYKEIHTLRNQIMDTISSLRKNEVKQEEKDSNILDELRSTILEQGNEILALKQELKQSERATDTRYSERMKEAEDQISFWTKRTEAQSKQYESLLQKLNDVTNNAKDLRELAEKERKRAEELQVLLLENNRNNNASEKILPLNIPSPPQKKDIVEKNTPKQITNKQTPPNKLNDRDTLENLHRKAHELLHMSSISSSLSDSSSIDKDEVTSKESNQKQNMPMKNSMAVNYVSDNLKKEEKCNGLQRNIETNVLKNKKNIERNLKKKKSKSLLNGMLKENALVTSLNSPKKIIRAKLAEDVNSRMVSLGVDPLKSRLPQNLYHKQRVHLQKQQELKTKINPSNEKIRHSILTYLDSRTPNIQNNTLSTNKYNIQEIMPNAFKGLRSMMSGVKTKAISLIKVNDSNVNDKRKSFGTEVAKRAISLIKTPPGSAPTSPKKQNLCSLKSDNCIHDLSQTNTDSFMTKNKKTTKSTKGGTKSILLSKSNSSESLDSFQKCSQKSSKEVDNLIKSPARRPSSAISEYEQISVKQIKQHDTLTRTQSTLDLHNNRVDNYESSDEVKSLSDLQSNVKTDDDALMKKTKSVLKNASSTSCLNKKKVIFDMDAIQMKSLSATPSQSITDKSNNENFELGLINLDTEEWDLSSIENEQSKNTKFNRTSTKIAELKRNIESQLVRRTEISSGLVGRVDVLGINMPITKESNTGGSNTSLGSSIFDDSDIIPADKRKTFAIPKQNTYKENSELEISEFSNDEITNTNKNEYFYNRFLT